MKLKIGDKVKHEIYGIGEIVYIDIDDNYTPFAVRFENSHQDLHNLGGACGAPKVAKKHGYWCSEDDLELLTREPQNIIPEIAKMLGVEIGEEFYLKGWNSYPYKFDSVLLSRTNGDNYEHATVDDYEYILTKQNLKIEKLPKKPQLTEAERVILENLPKKYKWITRDKEGLYCHENKPRRTDRNVWIDSKYALTENLIYEHLFEFIKINDEEPYNIEELLKGE